MKKNGTQKSHATPPLNGLIDAGDDIDDVVVVYTTLPHLAMSNPRYLHKYRKHSFLGLR